MNRILFETHFNMRWINKILYYIYIFFTLFSNQIIIALVIADFFFS